MGAHNLWATVQSAAVAGAGTATALPADAGTIPGDTSGVMAFTTPAAGDYDLTLADPTSNGQILIIGIESDGGSDLIITADTTFDGTNTIATMADVDDCIMLVSMGTSWTLIGNKGAALS